MFPIALKEPCKSKQTMFVYFEMLLTMCIVT